MNEKKENKGLKKNLNIKVTEFAEVIIDDDVKMVEQKTMHCYPEGYIIKEDEELPEPIKEENWYNLFNYPKVKVDKHGELKPYKKGPNLTMTVVDEEDYLEDLNKIYKFEVIFVNLGDDYNDDPKEELQHFIEEGLNRWSPMNAIVMISDVREREVDWDAEETQRIYNSQDSDFDEWNNIFVMKDVEKRIEQMREEWDADE